jgi:RNA recognition motif-containing protein
LDGVYFLIREEIIVGKKLYCGNLSYGTRSGDLETLFSEYGEVASSQVIEDRDTGRSKGFGFVEMDSDDDAAAAIEGLDGTEQDGRTIKVNEAQPRKPRSDGGGGGGGGGGRW